MLMFLFIQNRQRVQENSQNDACGNLIFVHCANMKLVRRKNWRFWTIVTDSFAPALSLSPWLSLFSSWTYKHPFVHLSFLSVCRSIVSDTYCSVSNYQDTPPHSSRAGRTNRCLQACLQGSISAKSLAKALADEGLIELGDSGTNTRTMRFGGRLKRVMLLHKEKANKLVSV